MNINQAAELTMTKSVIQNFDENSLLIGLVPALKIAINELKEKVAAIDGTVQLVSEDLTGITVDKKTFRSNLCNNAVDMSGLIYAYASATLNNALKEEVNHTRSELQRLRDVELVPVCRIIHARGTENLAALADYGITAEMLTELQSAIDAFAEASIKPLAAKSRRKTGNINLVERFAEIRAILTQRIDKLMNKFRTTHPDFYENHFNLREIKDPHTTTTTLKGIITDKSDGKPIKGAIITVANLGKTATTDSKGEYLIKPIENGKHLVQITKEGYQPFEDDEIEVKMGNIRHLDVSLVSN